MRKIGLIYYYVFAFSIISCNEKENSFKVQVKKLDYPSASSVEYYDGRLYVMGDDAANILVLDSNLNLLDSIALIEYSNRRIPKDIKPDLESSAFYKGNGQTLLFFFGSGSLSPYRNWVWLRFFEAKLNRDLSFEDFYNDVKKAGIEQINIEGACFIPTKLLLINRGNKSYPYNHLVVTDEKFWENDSNYSVSLIPFEIQKDTASFKGVSGLCYSEQSDKLIMTVSTEDTRSSYEDGAIGKSYLWIINNISTKLSDKTIKYNRLIDLEYTDPRFKGQKIESATIIKETDKLIYLVLVADNDDGSSTIFKMSINKSISHGE